MTQLAEPINLRPAVAGPAPKARQRIGIRAHVGEVAITQSHRLLELSGLMVAVLVAGIRPRTWRRTIRSALVRQVLLSGVEAIGIVCFLAVPLGVLLLVQYEAWVGKVVQSRLLGPVLVVIVVRELGPLLVNLITIARSGNTIATELGLMHVSGETRLIEGQGLNPVSYMVVPRVFGLIISVCCLTLIFIAVTFLSVYVCGQWIGARTGTFPDFIETALGSVSMEDILNVLLKCTIPPLLAGCICCVEGFNAGDTFSEVPGIARVAVQRSVVLLFLVSAVISFVTYL
jgi:phospholipid/cholesterol/gamma-HCH transport system permease protein